jgi:hypothetical protein
MLDHRLLSHRLAGVDDLYTARAADLQPAPAGCWVVAHRKPADVDDLYTARAADRQPAPAGCRKVAHRDLRVWTTSKLHGPPTCSRLRGGSLLLWMTDGLQLGSLWGAW